MKLFLNVMANWSEDIKLTVWRKGKVVPLLSADEYRYDEQGALMKWDEYGSYSNMGWQIDHIYPESLLQSSGVPQDKIDDIDNLRPVNSLNNNIKSDDYPNFKSSMVYDSDLRKNVKTIKSWTVTENAQQRLKTIMGLAD